MKADAFHVLYEPHNLCGAPCDAMDERRWIEDYHALLVGRREG